MLVEIKIDYIRSDACGVCSITYYVGERVAYIVN